MLPGYELISAWLWASVHVTCGVHIARTELMADKNNYAAPVTPFRFSSVHSVRYERMSGSGNTPSPRPHIEIKARPWELRL